MALKITIIDYEMGNLKSIYKCLKHLGVKAEISDKQKKILDSDGVILPGVGAFGDAMNHLKNKNLVSVIHQYVDSFKNKPNVWSGFASSYSENF